MRPARSWAVGRWRASRCMTWARSSSTDSESARRKFRHGAKRRRGPCGPGWHKQSGAYTGAEAGNLTGTFDLRNPAFLPRNRRRLSKDRRGMPKVRAKRSALNRLRGVVATKTV